MWKAGAVSYDDSTQSQVAAMRRHVLSILLLLPAAGEAQVPSLIPGSRVRVESRAFRKELEGTVMAQTADSVTIASVGAVKTVLAHSSIYRVRVSEGKSHGAGAVKGAKIGAGIGGVLGLALGFAAAEIEGNQALVLPVTMLYASSGALWGLGIGGIVGAEKWTTVHASPLRLAVGRAQSGATTLGLSMTF
jgi:hypothetical protein